MYKLFLRPILFKLDPETAHKLVFGILKLIQFLPLNVLKPIFNPKRLNTETTVFGLKFPNKVGIAAGLDKNAEIYTSLGNLGFGHVEIGTVTPVGQPGNAKPRLFRLINDRAIINRMGFNNYGLEAAITKLKNRNNSLIIGGNIGKNTLTPNSESLQDYEKCFNGLYTYVNYLVVNVSCPNITDLHKLQDQDSLELILNRLNELRAQKDVYKPILLKISPDLSWKQIDETIEVIQRNKIDGIIAVNTTTTRDFLTLSQDEISTIGNGGLSGIPLKNRSNEVISYIHSKTDGKLPIIGVGGVFCVNDAIEKLNAGASLIQIYSGFIYEGPALAKKINRAIRKLQM